jgi:hypothetical protein
MVKCAECGYLAVRNKETRQLEEVEEWHREKGDIPKKPGTTDPIYNPAICFVRGDYVVQEEKEKVLAEICKERACKLFVQWQKGFTPKEHREMKDREKMLEWQSAREDTDRHWKDKQDKKLVYIAGGFTILGAVIGALIAIIN